MRHHGIEQLRLAQSRVAKAKFGIRRAFLTEQLSRRYTHARDKPSQHIPRWRRLQIFDDMRLDARIADHRQGVARSPAIRVVIDDDIHGLPRSEEHTSELQSLMRSSYAVFCLKKKKKKTH